jgi:hydroxymethylbilane synthase
MAVRAMTPSRTLRIGTRGSALALVQARWVAARLSEHGVATELVIIRTEGDDRPVDLAWGEGAFVGRIVSAMLEDAVDVAVHSAKDVPTVDDLRVVTAAYPIREDARDALVCRVRGMTLATLPPGSRVGTDSPRRTAFLRGLRSDLVFAPLHGNVDTRLAKLDRGDADALVLAVAGLSRLGRADRIDEILSPDRVPWAPGQGSLAVQVRSDDREAIDAVARLDDRDTRIAVEAERALLNATGGGCRSPIGASARISGGRLELVVAAERELEPGANAAIAVARVASFRGAAPVSGHLALARRLAARVVAARVRRRVLIGRPDGRAEPLAEALTSAGFETVHVPAIEIQPTTDAAGLAELARLAAPGTIVAVTSANAAAVVIAALAAAGIDPATLEWAAVGDATAAALSAAGIGDVFLPSRADAVTLAEELPLARGQAVLLPRADIADAELPDALRRRGADVHEVVAYRTVEAPEPSRALLAAALDDGPIDALVVTSPSVARGLVALAADADRDSILAIPVIAGGERAAAGARAAGFGVVVEAAGPDPASVATAVAGALGGS